MSTKEELRDLPIWPDVPRAAFDKGGPAKMTAALGWLQKRERDLSGPITGYGLAAEAIIADAEENGRSPEYMLFPLAFAWRHHLELTLKEIIANGRQRHGHPWEFPEDHNLKNLWTEARVFLQEHRPNKEHLKNVQTTIMELHAIDPGSFGFRYMRGKGGRLALKDAPSHVNLVSMHRALFAVSRFLEAARMVQRHSGGVAGTRPPKAVRDMRSRRGT